MIAPPAYVLSIPCPAYPCDSDKDCKSLHILVGSRLVDGTDDAYRVNAEAAADDGF